MDPKCKTTTVCPVCATVELVPLLKLQQVSF